MINLLGCRDSDEEAQSESIKRPDATGLHVSILPLGTGGFHNYWSESSIRPMHFFGRTRDHDYYFELLPREGQNPQSVLDSTPWQCPGRFCVRTEFHNLLVK